MQLEMRAMVCVQGTLDESCNNHHAIVILELRGS